MQNFPIVSNNTNPIKVDIAIDRLSALELLVQSLSNQLKDVQQHCILQYKELETLKSQLKLYQTLMESIAAHPVLIAAASTESIRSQQQSEAVSEYQQQQQQQQQSEPIVPAQSPLLVSQPVSNPISLNRSFIDLTENNQTEPDADADADADATDNTIIPSGSAVVDSDPAATAAEMQQYESDLLAYNTAIKQQKLSLMNNNSNSTTPIADCILDYRLNSAGQNEYLIQYLVSNNNSNISDNDNLVRISKYSEWSIKPELDHIISLFNQYKYNNPIKLLIQLKYHQLLGIDYIVTNLINNTGCILADAMGMQKTIQALLAIYLYCCSISRNSNSNNIQKILLLTPSTVLQHWLTEITLLSKWGVEFNWKIITIDSTIPINDRYNLIEQWASNNNSNNNSNITANLLLINYEMYSSIVSSISNNNINNTVDILLLDESHRLRNIQTQIRNQLNSIITSKRILLSGTIMQNNLTELYSMTQYARYNNTILANNYNEFKLLYIQPIMEIQSSQSIIINQSKRNRAIRRAYSIYNQLNTAGLLLRRSNLYLTKLLPPLYDLTIYIRMSEQQYNIYTNYLLYIQNQSATASNSNISTFDIFSFISMLAAHPAIIRASCNERDTDKLKRIFNEVPEATINNNSNNNIDSTNISNNTNRLNFINSQLPRIDQSIDHSGKFQILLNIIESAKLIGDRCVIFSRWIYTLDYCQYIIKLYNNNPLNNNKLINYYRFDGSTPQSERQSMITQFNSSNNSNTGINSNNNIDVFLISTACGEGFNLSSANRVILLDCGFNPSIDYQSAMRVYRQPQSKSVYIYRLILTDSIEEKIYSRQLNKLLLNKWIIDQSSYSITESSSAALKYIQYKQFFNQPKPLHIVDSDSNIINTEIYLPDQCKIDSINNKLIQSFTNSNNNNNNNNNQSPPPWITEIFLTESLFNNQCDSALSSSNSNNIDSELALSELEWDRAYIKTRAVSTGSTGVSVSALAELDSSADSIDLPELEPIDEFHINNSNSPNTSSNNNNFSNNNNSTNNLHISPLTNSSNRSITSNSNSPHSVTSLSDSVLQSIPVVNLHSNNPNSAIIGPGPAALLNNDPTVHYDHSLYQSKLAAQKNKLSDIAAARNRLKQAAADSATLAALSTAANKRQKLVNTSSLTNSNNSLYKPVPSLQLRHKPKAATINATIEEPPNNNYNNNNTNKYHTPVYNTSKIPCKYYQRGHCLNANCTFVHQSPNTNTNSNSSQSTSNTNIPNNITLNTNSYPPHYNPSSRYY